MNLKETTQVLAVISGLYPNVSFNEAAPAAWQMFLANYSKDDILAALPDVMHRKQDPQFAPSAAELAQAVDNAKQPKVNPQMAWATVTKAIQKCGIMQPDRCRDWIRENTTDVMGSEAIIRAADTIGWRRLGLTPVTEHEGLFYQFKSMLGDTMAQEDRETLQKAIGVMADEARAIEG
jgi:hypothetical protein